MIELLFGLALSVLAAGIICAAGKRQGLRAEEKLKLQLRAGMGTTDGAEPEGPKGLKERAASVWRR